MMTYLLISLVLSFITTVHCQDWSSEGANIFNSRHLSLNQTLIRGANLNLNLGPAKTFTVGGQIVVNSAIFGDYLV